MAYEDNDRLPRSGEDRRVVDNNGKVSWDFIIRISQVAIYPLLAAMVYMMMQMSTLDRRLAVIEVTTSRPSADVGLVRQLAVIEERQGAVMRRLDAIETTLQQHREKSSYDPAGVRRVPRE